MCSFCYASIVFRTFSDTVFFFYLSFAYLTTWESESELLHDWRFTASKFVLVTSPLRITTRNFIFQLNTCCQCPYVTSSLTRDGCVVSNCCWHWPAQSILGPSPEGLMTTFYCLRFETPSPWRTRSPYLYPPVTGWPGYTPRHWVPFSSPPTTRRATRDIWRRLQFLTLYSI
jgi:hypothetical protein